MPGLLRLGLPVRRFHQLSRIVTSKVSRNYVLFLAAVTPPSLHCTVFRKRLSVLESVSYGQVTFVTSVINSRSGTPPGAISSSRIDPKVASHESALKAHRQNLKRREHNRQLRTRLRGALKDIRAAIDTGDTKNVKDALRATISMVDKMAAKGLIHRNTAGRYKSRLAARVTKRSAAA
jgi:small subunit ribosomal protein S20